VRGRALSEDAASPLKASEADSGSLCDAVSTVPRLLGKGGHFEDVNDDGLTDLLSHYRTQGPTGAGPDGI